jgi:hypothetical protein
MVARGRSTASAYLSQLGANLVPGTSGSAQNKYASLCVRPHGPGDPSPGPRPKADALGKGAPWCGLKGRENPARQKAPAALQAATCRHPSTQGIGLRPRPWAPFSRPVGPAHPRAEPRELVQSFCDEPLRLPGCGSLRGSPLRRMAPSPPPREASRALSTTRYVQRGSSKPPPATLSVTPSRPTS